VAGRTSRLLPGRRLGAVLAIPVQSFFELLDLFEQSPNHLLLKTDLFEEKRALRKKEAGDLFRIGPQKMKKEPLDQEREREWSCPRNAELRRKMPAGWIQVGPWTSLLRLCRDPPSGGPEQIPPSLGVVDVSEGRSNPIQKGVLFQGLNISNFQHFS